MQYRVMKRLTVTKVDDNDGGCNFCTEKGHKLFEVRSTNENRRHVIRICAECFQALMDARYDFTLNVLKAKD